MSSAFENAASDPARLFVAGPALGALVIGVGSSRLNMPNSPPRLRSVAASVVGVDAGCIGAAGVAEEPALQGSFPVGVSVARGGAEGGASVRAGFAAGPGANTPVSDDIR